MRVTRVIRSRVALADESGVTALMVAVTIVALFGSAAVAVDAGNLWTSRRHVINSADAAALAAASEYAVGGDGCASVASEYVSANDEDATLTACEPHIAGATAGYVSVEAETPVDFAFAGVVGAEDRPVDAATAAVWGLPSGVGGLRPFGLCEDNAEFQAWLAGPHGKSPVVRVFYTKEGTECGDAPGNWGIIDLDNTHPVSNSDVKEWVRNGYRSVVTPGWMGGDPGAYSNSLDGDLAAVQGEEFPIPVFDALEEQGSNSEFHVTGFTGIELVGWKTNGSEQSRYLELRFTEMVVGGFCCDPAGPDTGLRSVAICDVDPEFDPGHCT